MAETKIAAKIHPTEIEMSDFLAGTLSGSEKERLENHVASCEECLEKIISARESVELYKKKQTQAKGRVGLMNKINLYLILAIISFMLSFIIPRYFVQFLVATLLLGLKWIVDAKSTKMLITIYEAWKKGGEKEASQILKTFDIKSKDRF